MDESDASFVDVIHSNALVQGKIERCGHVDFYMNGGIIQPGCFQSDSSAATLIFFNAISVFIDFVSQIPSRAVIIVRQTISPNRSKVSEVSGAGLVLRT